MADIRLRSDYMPRAKTPAACILLFKAGEIDAYAELEVPILQGTGTTLQRAALGFDRAVRRIDHAAELDQEAVAHHLENAPKPHEYNLQDDFSFEIYPRLINVARGRLCVAASILKFL